MLIIALEQSEQVFDDRILMPTLLYGRETRTWYEYDKSRGRALGMDYLRPACGRRKIDRVKNEAVRDLCGMEKTLDESRGDRVCLGGVAML